MGALVRGFFQPPRRRGFYRFHRISTVFLGIDYGWGAGPPLLFETMVFEREAAIKEIFGRLMPVHNDVEQWRYASWGRRGDRPRGDPVALPTRRRGGDEGDGAMKKPLVIHTVSVPLSELGKMQHRCAWAGCTATTPRGPIPRDWRWLALWWGPPTTPPWGEGNVETRDAVLCPKHWRELDGLLEDIGQRLDRPEGRA